jgi:glucosamine--fructose-6-phosphate aminotransferase (isomerizing)
MEKASKSLEVPPCVDVLQGILTVIPLQLLSMHIATLRKLDVSDHNQESLPSSAAPPI